MRLRLWLPENDRRFGLSGLHEQPAIPTLPPRIPNQKNSLDGGRMSRALKLLVVAVLAGCTKADAPAVDTAAAPVPEVAAAPDAAGTWSVNVMPEGRDTTLLTYTM